MNMILTDYPALRTLADVEEIEKTPIEERITRWDFALNLIDGCRINPSRAALHVTCNGDLDGPLITWTFADLERRCVQVANLLRARGVKADDAVRSVVIRAAGERAFSVTLQGKPVLENFDVVTAAGGARRGVVKEFKGVVIAKDLKITFTRAAGAKAGPVLSGVELIAEKPQAAK